MIQMTESAIKKVGEIIKEENNEKLKIRIFVQGGGCSGMEYGFTFDEDTGEDDFIYPFDDIQILVDSMSYQYLAGSEIDFVDDLNGSSFKIKNPNAQTTCGCGSSFNPY